MCHAFSQSLPIRDGRRRDRSLIMIPNKKIALVGIVILSLVFTAKHYYYKGWFAAWNISDNLRIEQRQREKDSGIVLSWLAGRKFLGTAARTPAFGFCDKMPDSAWTYELHPIPDDSFSSVKAEYERMSETMSKADQSP